MTTKETLFKKGAPLNKTRTRSVTRRMDLNKDNDSEDDPLQRNSRRTTTTTEGLRMEGLGNEGEPPPQFRFR